jgi:hypothetical protein
MREILSALDEDTTIIHGGAPGADRMAGSLAMKLGFDIIVYYAEWVKHGKAAGAIRNRRMLDEEHPDLVIAFWDGSSPGTAGMIREAEQRDVEVWTILETHD